jgi:hypothetical protein
MARQSRFGSGIRAELGLIDYSPIAKGGIAAGESYAQAISNIGQIAGGAIRDYKKKKEEEKKISNTISFLEKAYNNDKEGFSFLADDEGKFDKAATEAATRAVGSDGIMAYANMSSAKAEKRDQKKIAAQVAELEQAKKSGVFDVVVGKADPRALQIFNNQEMEREAKARQGELVSSQVIKNLSDAGDAARAENAKLRQSQQTSSLVKIANSSPDFASYMKAVEQSGLPSENAADIYKKITEARALSSKPEDVRTSVVNVDLGNGNTKSLVMASVPGKGVQVLSAGNEDPAEVRVTKAKQELLKKAEDAYNAGDRSEALRLLRSGGFKTEFNYPITDFNLDDYFPKLKKSSGFTIEVE